MGGFGTATVALPPELKGIEKGKAESQSVVSEVISSSTTTTPKKER